MRAPWHVAKRGPAASSDSSVSHRSFKRTAREPREVDPDTLIGRHFSMERGQTVTEVSMTAHERDRGVTIIRRTISSNELGPEHGGQSSDQHSWEWGQSSDQRSWKWGQSSDQRSWEQGQSSDQRSWAELGPEHGGPAQLGVRPAQLEVGPELGPLGPEHWGPGKLGVGPELRRFSTSCSSGSVADGGRQCCSSTAK